MYKAIRILLILLPLSIVHQAICQDENRGTFKIKQNDTLFRVFIADRRGGTVTKEDLLKAGRLDIPFNVGGQITGFNLDIKYMWNALCDSALAEGTMYSTSARLTEEMKTAIRKTSNKNRCYRVAFFFHNIKCLSDKGKPVKGNDIYLKYM
jgi:hypothetical protein